MYMVGGGNSRVQRMNQPYPGATRWMEPSRPVKTGVYIDWNMVWNVAAAIVCFGVLVFLLNIAALALG